MDRKDFSDLEEQIRVTVENAFNSIDFTGIKNNVYEKTESTLNDVKTNFKRASENFNRNMEDLKTNINVTQKHIKNKQVYICKKPQGKVSGIVYMTLGTIGSVIFAIQLIVFSVFSSIWNSFSILSSISLGVLLAFFTGSIFMTFRGASLRKRIKRFRKYVHCLKGRSYCLIKELGDSVSKSEKYVVKDLEKMIHKGMFLEGHIDKEETYFMLTNEVYQNYLNSQEALKLRKEEEERRNEELKEEMNDPQKKELREIIENGNYYIKQIRKINDCLPEENISNKLYRLEKIVAEIFKYIEKNPNKLSDVSKFTNHYLPITLKLVTSYKELNEQLVQGENIKTAKNEIEKSIDLINTAFENLLDDMFEDVVLDISSDISVLETLFKQEGLTKNDFEKDMNEK